MITRDDIKVGSLIQFNHGRIYEITYTDPSKVGLNIREVSGTYVQSYAMYDYYLSMWSLLLSIEVGKNYTDGKNVFNVKYVDNKTVMAYDQTGVPRIFLKENDTIPGWKEYVKPKPEPIPVEYEVVWQKGGEGKEHLINACILPVNNNYNHRNILKREKLVYNP